MGFKSRFRQVEEMVNEMEIREQENKKMRNREKSISQNESMIKDPCEQSK